MSIIETLSYFLYPGVAIAIGVLLLMWVRKSANRLAIGRQIRDYLFGVIGLALSYPVCLSLLSLLLIAVCLLQRTGSLNPAAVNHFNYAAEFKICIAHMFHLFLASLGPGGAIGLAIGLAHNRIFGSRTTVTETTLKQTVRSRRFQLAAIIILSGIGWLSFFLWPLHSFELSPSL